VKVYLYNEGIEGLKTQEIRRFIKDNFGDIKPAFVRLKKRIVETSGLLLNFVETQKAFQKTEYPKAEDAFHIILTDRLFATLGEDRRLHIRASIYSNPSIISTSGIVEGPAKPKEYYIYKQKYTQLGTWDMQEAGLKRRFKDRFIDYADKRINQVLKGYIAQGLFFYITGEPFCSRKACRLYNAHWQEDLIYSQIKQAKFCSRHKGILNEIRK